MKFANKYELFEAVTSGRVETFFAKDLASGERVLLHIFEAPEKKPDQATVQWVLESFRKVAPDPAGLVIETGRYSGTTYAYLVTKLPDTSTLKRWTESYEASAVIIQPIATRSEPAPPAHPAKSRDLSPPSERPLDQPTPLRQADPPGEITAAFSPSPSPANARSETSSPGKADRAEINFGTGPRAPQRQAGEFTAQFLPGSHELPPTLATQSAAKLPDASAAPTREVTGMTKAQETAKAKVAERPGPGGGALTGKSAPALDSGAFTALFRSDFKPQPNAASDGAGAPGKADDRKAGDFTDFFRGPFDGERPEETPKLLPNPSDMPPRNAPGEFTMVFGSGKDNPFAPASAFEGGGGDAPRRDAPGAFTQLFPPASEPAAPSVRNPSFEARQAIAPKNEMPAPSQEPAWNLSAAPPPKAPISSVGEPIPPKSMVGSPVREAEPSVPRGATHVFEAPGELSGPPRSSGGPSEYTRIIAGGMGSPTPPVVPPPPKVAAPPPAKLLPPVPPAPKAPPLGVKPKPSYLPLVIILNVLLFVAILLIVYFAVKH
jgi:hypothetical protein